jgi:hypothetical protein
MADLYDFPAAKKDQAERRKLADWFRAIAAYIEADKIEHPPLAAMIVLSSADGDEVLGVGYQNKNVSSLQAGFAARKHVMRNEASGPNNFYPRNK